MVLHTTQVHFTHKWDWDSFSRHPVFTSNFVAFRSAPADKRLLVVIDVREALVDAASGSKAKDRLAPPTGADSSSAESVAMTSRSLGWTVLPVFDQQGGFCSGSYQLPLFEGSVNPALLEALARSDDVRKTLKLAAEGQLVVAESKAASTGSSRRFSLIGPSTSKQTSLNVSPAGWASVFVRVVDDQRGAIFPAPLDLTSTDFQFLFLSSKLEKHVQGSQDAQGASVEADLGKYAYVRSELGKSSLLGSKPKLLKALCPPALRGDMREFRKLLVGHVCSATGLEPNLTL